MTKLMKPGLHLLIDFWDAINLSNEILIEKAMRDAAVICGATILEVKLHSFGVDSGITGVAILAESHISIHTWPELNYLALDIFMCGICDPQKSIHVFREIFRPHREKISKYFRG